MFVLDSIGMDDYFDCEVFFHSQLYFEDIPALGHVRKPSTGRLRHAVTLPVVSCVLVVVSLC